MNRITIVFLILFPLVSFCQGNDSTKANVSSKVIDTSKCSKLEIGISFSPEYSYRKLKSNGDNDFIKEIRDTLEVPKYGYTLGLNLAYQLNKKIVIETGILFSDKGEKTKKIIFNSTPSEQSAMYYSYKYHYLYIDIPVKVNYYILTKKIKLYVTAGISTNIFLTQKTTLIQGHDFRDSEKTSTTFNPSFNRFNFALLAGAGVNYRASNKLNLKVEPIYSRSLNSITAAPIKEYLYSLGLNIGVYYKL